TKVLQRGAPVWLFVVLAIILVMLIGFLAISTFGSWWQTKQNDWKYGTPRTFQTDQYVNQGDSPQNPDHFIAVNLNGIVEVIQLNTVDPNKSHMYIITTTKVDPSLPVIVSFSDMNTDGKLDLVVTIGEGTDNPYVVVWLSNGTQFVKP